MKSQPGTALHRKLSSWGITPSDNCDCRPHIKEMDDKGLVWCENNVDGILDGMEKEAKKRHIIFFRFGARKVVNRVFKFCRKEECKND